MRWVLLLLGPELEQKGRPMDLLARGVTVRRAAILLAAAVGVGRGAGRAAVAARRPALLLAVLALALAAACSGTGADSSADGADSSADGAVERIVSISPTATEILFAIGAGDRVVAVDQLSRHPEEAPVTDLDGWNPNVEAIAAYEPDLVVMQGGGDVVASLEALGVAVISQGGPAAFDDVYAQIEQLGAATGNSAEAADVILAMQARIDDLIADAPEAGGLTYYHELDDTLYSVTSDTFIGEVYGLFGLASVADPADAGGSAFGYPQLSAEYLIDADPDLIFLADTLCCEQSAETVAERPGWDRLSAVRDGRVVELNDDIVSRWGPRLVEFVEAISEALDAVVGDSPS